VQDAEDAMRRVLNPIHGTPDVYLASGVRDVEMQHDLVCVPSSDDSQTSPPSM